MKRRICARGPGGHSLRTGLGRGHTDGTALRICPRGDRPYRHLLEAYTRVAAEVLEEQRGDAVSAQISEGAFADELKSGESIGLGGFGTVGRAAEAAAVSAPAYRFRQGGKISTGAPGRGCRWSSSRRWCARSSLPPCCFFRPYAGSIGPDLDRGQAPRCRHDLLGGSDHLESRWMDRPAKTSSASTRPPSSTPRCRATRRRGLAPTSGARAQQRHNGNLSAGIIVSADGESPILRSGLLGRGERCREISVPLGADAPDGWQGPHRPAVGRRGGAGCCAATAHGADGARRVQRTEDMLVRGTGTLTLGGAPSAVAREGAEVTVQVGLATCSASAMTSSKQSGAIRGSAAIVLGASPLQGRHPREVVGPPGHRGGRKLDAARGRRPAVGRVIDVAVAGHRQAQTQDDRRSQGADTLLALAPGGAQAQVRAAPKPPIWKTSCERCARTKQVEFDIMFGEGVSKVGELIDLGVKAGIVESPVIGSRTTASALDRAARTRRASCATTRRLPTRSKLRSGRIPASWPRRSWRTPRLRQTISTKARRNTSAQPVPRRLSAVDRRPVDNLP